MRSPRTPDASLLYLLGTGLQALSILFVIPIARPLLGAHEWGFVALSQSVIQLGTVALAAGLPLAITRFHFDLDHGPRQARAVSTMLGLAGIVVAGLSACAFVVLQDRPWAALLLAGCVLGCQTGIIGTQAVLRAQRRPLFFVVLSLLSSSIPHVGGVVSAHAWGTSAVTYLLGYLGVVGLAVLLSLWLVAPARLDVRVARRALALGLPAVPHSLALMAMLHAPVALVGVLGSPSQAGTYFVAQVVAVGCLQVLGALNNVWVPDVMEASATERGQRFDLVAAAGHRAGVALALMATGLAPFAMAILAGDQPALATPASVLALVSVPYVGYLMATTALFAEGRTRSMAVVTPVVSCLGIVVMAAAAASESLLALSVAFVASYGLLAGVYWRVLAHVSPRSYPVSRGVLLGLVAAGGSVIVVEGSTSAALRAVAVAAGTAWWWTRTRGSVGSRI